jgi:hypothetical protein
MDFSRNDSFARRLCIVLALVVTSSLFSATVMAGVSNNTCEEGESPDVIVGSIQSFTKFGTSNGITAWAFGTTSCNEGTCWLDWFQHPSNLHPVIGQTMYRLMDGRMEMIGQGWLKHGFFALSQTLCFPDCIGTSGTHLGVHCSDPYSSGLNGQQTNLGPKFEVNAATGVHPHPVTDIGLQGNSIFKRLQVHNSYLEPTANPGAQYFVEAQYITADDHAAGNHANNASWRPLAVTGSAGNYNVSFIGGTARREGILEAWQSNDSDVELDFVDIPNDGRVIVGSKVTDNGDGTWHYEYAINNLNSHRSVRAWQVPIPDGINITNIEFHDVPYHSGETQNGNDWIPSTTGFQMRWETDTDANVDSTNALRWSTTYNFRFDADVAPATNPAMFELLRPGLPGDPDVMFVELQTPSLCNFNSICDPGESGCNCGFDCGAPPAEETTCGDSVDNDCDLALDCNDSDCCGAGGCPAIDADSDAALDCEDCDDSNGVVWASPGAVTNVLLAKDANGTMSWDAPASPGATSVTYDVLRSRNPQDFVNFTQCVSDPDPSNTSIDVPGDPLIGMYAYLIRAVNDCPEVGDGSAGADSEGTQRDVRSCQ